MVAALFVILIHVSCQGFYSFSDFWIVCVKFDSAARMAVPLFFLLSGYFLFSDKPPMLLASFLKRRFSRILIPLILTFVIYLVVRHWTFSDWIHRIFTGQISFHLWFMYALVGLYLAVLLFQPLFTTEAGRKIALYYVVLWLCCAVFYAYAKRYFGLSFNPFGQFNFHYFFGFMGFFFTGGLLRRVRVTLCWRWFWALVCVLATVLIYRFTKSWSLSLGSPNELFLRISRLLSFCRPSPFFLALKDIKLESALLTFVAEHTYWIYLVHMLAMGVLQKYTGLYVNVHTALHIVLITVGTFVLAFIVSIPLYLFEKTLVRCLHLR